MAKLNFRNFLCPHVFFLVLLAPTVGLSRAQLCEAVKTWSWGSTCGTLSLKVSRNVLCQPNETREDCGIRGCEEAMVEQWSIVYPGVTIPDHCPSVSPATYCTCKDTLKNGDCLLGRGGEIIPNDGGIRGCRIIDQGKPEIYVEFGFSCVYDGGCSRR